MANAEFEEGDRVTDIMFPEYGPATLKQHPNPRAVRDGRDKWLVEFDDRTKPTFWIGKYMAHTQVRKIPETNG